MIKEELIKFAECAGVAAPCVIGLIIGMWLYFWEYYIIKEQSHYDHIVLPE